MGVLIANNQSKKKVNLKKIRTTAQAVLNALGCPEGELSVLIVDDRGMADLNARHLNRAGPTNVIAFPMREGDHSDINPDVLGDVVISVDTAHHEAGRAGMETMERFNELLIHGILHLVGYDHVNSEEEAAVMEKKSSELMKLIGKEE